MRSRHKAFRIFAVVVGFSLALLWDQGRGLFAMPPVHRMVLQNRLVLLVIEEHALPVVTLQLLVNSGSWKDPPGEEGLAYLTAQGILHGTSGHTAEELSRKLDFIGTSLDIDCDKDYATFGLQVLEKDLDAGFDLFMDAVTDSVFPEDEFVREKEKTLGAIRSAEDQPSDVAGKVFEKALFLTSPYAHPVEGTKESAGGLGRDAVLRFYGTNYRPNLSVLAVVGDISLDEVKSKLVPRLEKWQAAEAPEVPFIPSFAAGPETIGIDRPITQANIILGHEGVERQNKDYYALSVMNFILGGGDFTSRLLEEIRVKRGLVYFVGSVFVPRKHPGSFQVALGTKNESAGEAVSLVRQEMERIRTEPVSERELEVARKYLVGSFPLRFQTQKGLAAFFCQVEFLGLGLDYPEKYPSLIDSVTREDVLRVARTYLHPDKAILVVVGNLKEVKLE